MILNKVVLLAAQTARSQAYVQTLAAHGLPPGEVILMAPPERAARVRPRPSPPPMPGLVLPDLNETVAQTCARAGLRCTHADSRDVNDALIADAIRRTNADIVIYSGYGGQIVASHILNLGPKFLHMHSGWLPEYRGSTTVYYALLGKHPPAVSALLLDRNIDTGPIVARRRYPVPPAGMDVDSVYDAAIRADLLARVLKDYAATGVLAGERQEQASVEGPYFVVHPVLKHLALLSLQPSGSADD